MEDLQPNEVRRARKGSVPLVRPASYPHNPYRRVNTNPETWKTSTLPGQSLSAGADTATSFPVAANSSPARPSLRTAGFSKQEHIPKSRKLDHLAFHTSARSRSGDRFDIGIDLPFDCFPGTPGCQKRRRKWIEDQIIMIQRERNAFVYMHSLKGLRVIFSCRSLTHAKGSDNAEYLGSDEEESLLIDTYLLGPSSVTTASQGPSSSKKASSGSIVPPLSSLVVDLRRTTHDASLGRSGDGPPFTTSPAQSLVHDHPRFRSGILTIKRVPSPSQIPSPVPSLTLYQSLENDPSTNPSLSGSVSPLASVEIRTENDSLRSIHNDGELDGSEYQTLRLQPPLYDLDVDLNAQIITQPHEKARRLLLGQNRDTAYNISTHGSIDFLEIIPSFRQSQVAVSPGLLPGTIDDACLLSTHDLDCIVLAHSGQSPQLSFVGLADNKPFSVNLNRPCVQNRKPGVGSVVALTLPRAFVSGGHDRVVHRWNVEEDFMSAQFHPLSIKHTSLVTSFLPVDDTSHKLISASADCSAHLYDFVSERVTNTIKTSNCIYHVHATESPFCTLLEVAHRELQFEVRDHRIVPEVPVQRFGYASVSTHGRFVKGDAHGSLFACGSKDGYVRLWDLRSLKVLPAEILCLEGQKVVQVSFAFSRLLALSKDQNLSVLRYSNKV